MSDNPRRTRVLFTLLILTSLILLTVDYQGNASSPLRPLERGVAVVIGPVQRVIGNGMTSITGGVHFGTDQTKRIAELDHQNQELAQKLAVTELDRKELGELKDLSALTDRWQIVPTRVIGRGSAPSDEWTLLVDVGSADGVKVESTVITGAGLLGKIIKVDGPHQSTVRLLKDPTMGVAVAIARDNEWGFVQGAGDEPMQLTLDSALADMKVGDVVVTRGSAANVPYYPGIAVGTVTKISANPGSTFRIADVTPFAQAGNLEFIGVIIGPGPDVPRSPLPTKSPAAKPAATPASGTATSTAPATPAASGTAKASPTPTPGASG